MSSRESFPINNFLFKTFSAIGDIKVVNKRNANVFWNVTNFFFLLFLYLLLYSIFLYFLCAFFAIFFPTYSFIWEKKWSAKKYVIEFVFEWKVTHYKILGRIEACVSCYCFVNKLPNLSCAWLRCWGSCLMFLNFNLFNF